MKTVAIIAEYNPFHTGHQYHIEKIRSEFGIDTKIIAVMSGNYTQRGDIAFADKSLRAECAVRCGVDLVLELPFPYSVSSAELFSNAAVHIINSLGVVDVLSFGSESGNINELRQIAENMLSDKYQTALSRAMKSDKSVNKGYPLLCSEIYQKLFSEDISSFSSPNNILAIEYIKSIIRFKSGIVPHTILRFGADYNDDSIVKNTHQSATAIRTLMQNDFNSAIEYLPDNSKTTLIKAHRQKMMPCDAEKLSAAVISNLRLNPTAINIHDMAGGLYNRLQNASFEAFSISNLIELTDTKKFTTARIRRAVWYSFFGVTSSELLELPAYTQALAMNSVGMAILKNIKKVSSFKILTKPSVYSNLDELGKRQKELSDKADSVFHLTKPSHVSGKTTLKTSPFIMNAIS